MSGFCGKKGVMMKESVNSLVMRAQNGDIEAFEKLVERFQDAVFGAAYATVRNFHDAQEIAQEAFILTYQELPRLREPEKFPGWLRRLTITACNRFLGSRRREWSHTAKPRFRLCAPSHAMTPRVTHEQLSTVMDIPSELPGPDVLVEAKELKEQILLEISTLSEKNREVVTLFFINGYSHKEISDFLEVPVSTVKGRLHESRKKLQRRLITMAKDVLHSNKPGTEFVRQLKEKLNGRIIELPDGRIQVFYDFVDERQLQDWRVFKPYKAEPKVKEGGLAFGRVEPEETDKQWDRDIRHNLVLDSNPQFDLEIEFDVIWGTNEPWSSAALILTGRDGYGSDIPFFQIVITDCCEEWRRHPERNAEGKLKDGYVRADLVKRGDPRDEKGAGGYIRSLFPTRWDVPIAECYHMKVTRHKSKLCWDVNGEIMGEAELADDELCLTERLVLYNCGKGTGAIFRNLVIRSRIVEVAPSWPAADREEG
jgi:RNA polymerase sigma-70 factor (ECF subfamily)